MKNAASASRTFRNFKVAPKAFRKASFAIVCLVAVAFFLLMPHRVEAASKFWIASGPGNLNDNANWSTTSGGAANTTAPGAGDSARFDGNGLGNCTITTNVTLQSMLIGSGYSGTITVASGVDLTLGPFSFFQMDAGTFNASNGTFLINAGEGSGSFIQNGGVFNGNGTVDLNVANVTLNGGIFNATAGNTTFHRSFTRNAGGNFNPNNGTVIMMSQAGGGMSFSGPATEIFNNLILNNTGNFSIGGTAEVAGALTLNSGTFASGTLDAKGAVTVAAPFIGTNGLLQISGTDARIVSLAAGANLPNVTLNAPNVTVETSGSGTINWRALTLQAGTINQGPVNFVFSGSYSQSGGTFNGGIGTFSVNPGLLGTFAQSGGDFNGNGTIDLNVSNATFSGGTFHATPGNTTFHRGFTRSTGTFDANNGTVIFETQPGTGITLSSPATQTFNNLSLNHTGDNFNLSGTAVVLGTLTLASGLVNGGTFQAQGDVVVQNTFGFGSPATGGTTSIRFSEINNQTFTNNGGANPTGTWTINKTAGKVTLASNLILNNSQALNITSGTLDQGPSFNLQTSNTLTIGANGVLRAFGTGNLILGGNLSNSGLINLNGGGTGCNDPNVADPLLIQSSDTTSRTWSGSGTFSLVDVDIDRQTVGSPPNSITAFGTSHLTNTTGFLPNAACPVTITSQPTNQDGCPGGQVTFTVGASGSGLLFQWRKNTVNLSNGGNVSGVLTNMLSINPATAGDVGSYDAVVSNALGITATSNAAALSLLAAPMITSSPSNATRCEGQSVTFMASASGAGLTFQWRKGGNPIGGATGNSLTIDPVTAADAGSYDVVVSGTCSPPATSAAATLTVNTAPAISANPANATVCEGSLATLTATASASPNPTVQWQVSTDGGANFGDIGGATSTTLSFTAGASQNGNKYRAVFTNSCNSTTTTAATLTVSGFSLAANSQSFSNAGGSGSVDVINGNGCGWTAVSNDSFIHIISGGSGSGNGTVNFSVDSTSSARAGTLTIAGNTFTVNQSGPTAADGNVSGRIMDSDGNPIEGVAVLMSGTQNRLMVTDANGIYRFDNVETNGFYTVTPSRVNYSFSPSARSFSQLGNQTEAAFIATPNGGNLNPLDTTEYFVRRHYVDFLGREPDEAGFTFWVSNIERCGAAANCREVARIDTSAAFFLSIEFQQTGFLVYRTYKAAYGDIPVPVTLSEFKPDTQEISNGVVVQQSGWEGLLENNTQAYLAKFVQRSRFNAAYPLALSPAEFVERLFANAGVLPSDKDRMVAVGEFGSATTSADAAARGRALRRVAENATLARQEFKRAFVLVQYFGYLRRNPNDAPEPGLNFDGYNFWLNKLNQFNGDYVAAEMVKAFITSEEYRRRFGPE